MAPSSKIVNDAYLAHLLGRMTLDGLWIFMEGLRIAVSAEAGGFAEYGITGNLPEGIDLSKGVAWHTLHEIFKQHPVPTIRDAASDRATFELSPQAAMTGVIRTDVFKTIGKPRLRALNSWMAFRTFYAPFFHSRQQKVISPIMTLLWHEEPYQHEWSVIAAAYTEIRALIGKHNAPLHEFLKLVCPEFAMTPRDEILHINGLEIHGEQAVRVGSRKPRPQNPVSAVGSFTIAEVLKTSFLTGYISDAEANHLTHQVKKSGRVPNIKNPEFDASIYDPGREAYQATNNFVHDCISEQTGEDAQSMTGMTVKANGGHAPLEVFKAPDELFHPELYAFDGVDLFAWNDMQPPYFMGNEKFEDAAITLLNESSGYHPDLQVPFFVPKFEYMDIRAFGIPSFDADYPIINLDADAVLAEVRKFEAMRDAQSTSDTSTTGDSNETNADVSAAQDLAASSVTSDNSTAYRSIFGGN